GNGQYERLAPVPSAESDAKAMAALLRDAYGFEVTLLLNAKNAEILSNLYKLSQSLAENDNLVVYYAGHGRRDLRNRRGWWLAADAGADSDARTNWIPNQEVSDRLGLIPARHILVVADASYVGDITRGAPQPEPRNLSADQWAKYVDTTKQRRARLALSSGADEPLPGPAKSSTFTATLIDALKRQKGVFPASRIHREVVNALTADDRPTSAIPTYAPLQSVLHDGVDFLFERR
ncbi:MAG TPA: caspase family protein, partial [Thermoanaerobaculia bacterium]|nr:caspase family protein [Thermoanaerobaculia bacterium]